MMPAQLKKNLFNHALDALARPDIAVRRRSLPAFKLCGAAGLACAFVLGLALTRRAGLSMSLTTLLLLSSVLAFLALAFATKVVAGVERLVYYHQEIAIITFAGLLLWTLRQPVLPYLDVMAPGLGMFLSCGRVGCLLVGCCHGRPHRWGVAYGAAHARAGFTRHLVGVRLFPVQAVESIWVSCVVFAGSLMVLNGRPAGSAFAFYVVAYDLGRFSFEFMRGDPERPYRAGFSEAQWTALGLTVLVAAAELCGLLPLQLWHVGAAVCLLLSMVFVASARNHRRTPKHELLHPRHVREIAEAIEAVSGFDPAANHEGAEIQVRRTSLGVLISASGENAPSDSACHYSLSFQNEDMDEKAAGVIAEVICQLKRWPAPYVLIGGRRAVFHLLLMRPPTLLT